MKGEKNKTISELLRLLICLSPVFRFQIPFVCMCVSVSFFRIVSESSTRKKKKKSKRIKHTELFALNVFYNLFIPLLMMQMAFQFFFSLGFPFAILSSFRFQLRMSQFVIFHIDFSYILQFFYIFISCLTWFDVMCLCVSDWNRISSDDTARQFHSYIDWL